MGLKGVASLSLVESHTVRYPFCNEESVEHHDECTGMVSEGF
jgi:hypothetical protein